MLGLAVYLALEYTANAVQVSKAKLDPIQALRSVQAHLLPSLYSTIAVMQSEDPAIQPLKETFQGQAYTFPDATTNTKGDLLLVVLPEDLASPADPAANPYSPNIKLGPAGNPDGVPDGSYTVKAIFTETMAPELTSRTNRRARQLVVETWFQIEPTLKGAPKTIDFSALGEPELRKIFALHILPGGYEVELVKDSAGSSVTGVELTFDCRYGNTHGAGGMEDEFVRTVLLRNHPSL